VHDEVTQLLIAFRVIREKDQVEPRRLSVFSQDCDFYPIELPDADRTELMGSLGEEEGRNWARQRSAETFDLKREGGNMPLLYRSHGAAAFCYHDGAIGRGERNVKRPSRIWKTERNVDTVIPPRDEIGLAMSQNIAAGNLVGAIDPVSFAG
jgi:hypothetical protein